MKRTLATILGLAAVLAVAGVRAADIPQVDGETRSRLSRSFVGKDGGTATNLTTVGLTNLGGLVSLGGNISFLTNGSLSTVTINGAGTTINSPLNAPNASSTAASAVANVGTLDARYIGTTGTNFTMTGNVGEQPTLTLTSTGSNTAFIIALQSRGAAGELYTCWARSANGVWRFNPRFDVLDGTSGAGYGDYILQAKSDGVTVGRTAGGSAGNFTVIGSATTSRVASVQFYANSTGTSPSNVVTFALGDARYPTNGASWTFGGILAASYGTDPASTGLTQNVAIGGTTLVFKAGIFTGTAP